jgi:hypothetical protein
VLAAPVIASQGWNSTDPLARDATQSKAVSAISKPPHSIAMSLATPMSWSNRSGGFTGLWALLVLFCLVVFESSTGRAFGCFACELIGRYLRPGIPGM